MIERFNFYDVYGYLLPGLAMLGMLWFPLWWLSGRGIPGGWWAAAIALLIAYLLGHLVARFAQSALRYGARQPSDLLLDDANPAFPLTMTFPLTMKAQLLNDMQKRFHLAVNAANADDRGKSRVEGFLLCRRALLREKAASYAEQFEGLYTMFRALSGVAFLSFAYYLGWAMADFAVTATFVDAAEFVVIPVLILAVAFTEHRWALSILAAVLFALGLYLGAVLVTAIIGREATLLLSVLSIGSLVLAFRFYLGYRFFADQFAITVFRDYFVLERAGSAAPR